MQIKNSNAQIYKHNLLHIKIYANYIKEVFFGFEIFNTVIV